MRIHRLRVQAFGPFPGAWDIDFDALGAGGLHLIHGATGSGKTSILDAICFAVFGQVAGTRHGVNGPANVLAAPDTPPEVDLEVTLSGRRLRFVRRPEHVRPKKRGDGVTTVRSSVALLEWERGRWQTISSRVQEVQHVVDTALGLHLDQFAQVIMLPQGGFAQFLHAEPDARAGVLRRLFDIERFVDLEHWFIERRRAATQDLAAARAPLDRARTVVELALAELPEPITLDLADAPDGADGPEGVPDPTDCPEEDLPELVTRIAQGVTDRATVAATQADAAENRARTTHAAHEQAQRAIALHAKGTQAQRILAELDAPAAAAAEDTARAELDAAERAARVAPTLRQARAADHDLDQAERDTAGARSAAVRRLPERGDDTAQSWSATVHGGDEPLRSASQHVSDLLAAVRQTVQAAGHGTRLTEHRVRLEAQVDDLEERRERIDAEIASQSDQAGVLAHADQLVRLVDSAARRVRQVREASEHEQLISGAVHDTDESMAVAARRAEQQRRAHVAQVTGRLAAELRDGEPCVVCGSTEHPAPAPAPGAVVTQDDVDAAEEAQRVTKEAFDAAMRDLTQARAAHTHAVAEAELALASTRSSAEEVLPGSTAEVPSEPAALDTWLQDVRSRAMGLLRDARQATARVAELRAEHDQIVTQIDSARTQLVDVRLDLASAQTRARAAAASVVDHAGRARADLEQHDLGCPCRATAEAEIARASDLPWPSGEVDGVVARLAGTAAGSEADVERLAAEMERRVLAHDHLASAIDSWRSAEQHRDQAEQRRRHAATTLTELLDQEGFTTSDEVDQRLRSPAEREQLVAQLEAQSRARTAAQTVLADPEVLAALDQPLPDEESLRAAAEQAQSAARSARELASALERARGTLLSAARELSAALDELRPLRARHEALSNLTAVLNAERGAAGDRRMRLSAYVLAARLEEVVRLANERLGTMTDHRFTLEHDDGPGSRGSRGGLGLRVHDAWTGTWRPTRSLSGGETFLASLALALALGDAIQQDAGGRQLETLFVDEGFGSLDEDSLELVLQVLDELRSGGRTVGIVSHVAELRQRIPAQIEVIKAETGSSVRVHLPGQSSAA